jgi:MarR family 2-MHQ and catechol resistance regulon transcriptional repressor
LCQGEISAKLLKSGGNVTFVVDNLVKSGLVERQRGGEDRRQVFVELTATGRELIEQVLPQQVAAITRVMGALDADEQEALDRLLKKLGTAKSDL